MAAARGFRYLRAVQVAKLPKDELLDRIAAVGGTDTEPDVRDAEALLEVSPEPQITVSRALELYWGLTADQLRGKNNDQVRRWKNPRIKAINNFVAVVGDKALADITGERAGLTQEELAARADVSARFVSLIETARRQPSLTAMHALSTGLGIQLRDLAAELEGHYEAVIASKSDEVEDD